MEVRLDSVVVMVPVEVRLDSVVVMVPVVFHNSLPSVLARASSLRPWFMHFDSFLTF